MKKDIISMNDMTKEEIMEILKLAKRIENTSEEEKLKILSGKIVSTLFLNRAHGQRCLLSRQLIDWEQMFCSCHQQNILH